MTWLNRRIKNEIKSYLQNRKPTHSEKIALVTEDLVAAADLIDAIVLSKYINFRYNFAEPAERNISLIPRRAVLELNWRRQKVFKGYINTLSAEKRQFVENALRTGRPPLGVRQTWFDDLFYAFIRFALQQVPVAFIFENVHLLSRSDSDELESFIMQMEEWPVTIIFTTAVPQLKFKNIELDKVFHIPTLTVAETEELVANHFRTERINARLITNHCYSKTQGETRLIRLLLETVYRPLFQESEKGFIPLQKLNEIKIPAQRDDLLDLIISKLTPVQRRFLGLLANLDAAIDFTNTKYLFQQMGLESSQLSAWIDSGLVQKIKTHRGVELTFCYPEWKTKLKQSIPIEEYANLLQYLQKGRKWLELPVSQLLYEAGQPEQAAILAQKEAEFLYSRGLTTEATGRLHFILRLEQIRPGLLENSEKVVSQLGEWYLEIGAYENAFDQLRTYRDWLLKENLHREVLQKEWIDVNLKMARCLIEMDAFPDAKYLLREIRVKKFIEEEKKAVCDELSGDIEHNLSAASHAWRFYLQAFTTYLRNNRFDLAYHLYQKMKALKPYFEEGLPELFDKVEREKVQSLDRKTLFLEIAEDYLRNQLEMQEYPQALKIARKMNPILAQLLRFDINLRFHFYLSEIYAHYGKQNFALQHLRDILKTPAVFRRTNLRIQSHFRRGLVLKELARFGPALSELETARNLSERHGHLDQKYETILHLGHLYLQVHSLLKANEYLKKSWNWAKQQNDHDLMILAQLYLTYYEIRQGRLDLARGWLKKTLPLLRTKNNEVDFLNYLFYFTLCLVEQKKLPQAKITARLLNQRSGKNQRLKAAAGYLQLLVYRKEGNSQKVLNNIGATRELCQKCGLTQLEFWCLIEVVRAVDQLDDEAVFLDFLKETANFTRKMLDNMGDEIFRTLFREARIYEDIFSWFSEYELE
ncbi:MAG: hypothetical protein Kow0037_01530 [Calditrichia bacterium]